MHSNCGRDQIPCLARTALQSGLRTARPASAPRWTLLDSSRMPPVEVHLPGRLSFQVRVPFEASHVIRDEGVRLLSRQRGRRAHLTAERRQELRGAELHVVEHFGDGVALYEVSDLVGAGL